MLSGHTDDVNWVAFAPDGRTLVSAGDDGTIRLWDVATRRETAKLTNPTRIVECALFSPQGTTLATTGADAVVRIWNVATQKVVGEWTRHRSHRPYRSTLDVGIEMLTYSGDGRLLASAGHDGKVVLHDLTTGQERNRLEIGAPALAVAFSPDDRHIAVADRTGGVSLWSTEGTLFWRKIEHRGSVRGVVFVRAFPPPLDGTFLLITCGEDGTVRSWDTETGKCRDQLTTGQGKLWATAVSRDAESLVTAGEDGSVKHWHAGQLFEKQLVPLNGFDYGVVLAVKFSPDGKRLAIGDRTGRVAVWDLSSRRFRAELTGHPREAWNVSFAPNGRSLASAAYGDRAVVWQLDADRPRLPGPQDVILDKEEAAVFTSDGLTLVTARRDELACRDWPSGTVRRRLPVQNILRAGTLVVSSDGLTAAVVEMEKNVVVWDLRTGETRLLGGSNQPIGRPAFSPDGTRLASPYADGLVKIWNLMSEHEPPTLLSQGSPIASVAFTPDGRTLATGATEGRVKLWHVATGQELFTLEGPVGSIVALAFSPDGRTLATGGHTEKPGSLLCLWPAVP